MVGITPNEPHWRFSETRRGSMPAWSPTLPSKNPTPSGGDVIDNCRGVAHLAEGKHGMITDSASPAGDEDRPRSNQVFVGVCS